MMGYLLEVQDLSVSFTTRTGTILANDRVSLNLNPGELWASWAKADLANRCCAGRSSAWPRARFRRGASPSMAVRWTTCRQRSAAVCAAPVLA